MMQERKKCFALNNNAMLTLDARFKILMWQLINHC